MWVEQVVERFEQVIEMKQYMNGMVRGYLGISDKVGPKYNANGME